MRLERTEDGFRIDAADLGPLLGIAPSEVPRLMREGRITSLSEEGRDADAGRFRVSFRYGSLRIRFILDHRGEVLLRTRTSVALRPGTGPTPAPHSPDGG